MMARTVVHEVQMQVWINNRGPYVPASFDINTEMIDVTQSGPDSRPDPAWRFVDMAGHFHAYAEDGSTPTLHHVADCADDDCDCSHDECLFVDICSICEEEIEPARLHMQSAGHKYVPGRRTWTLVVTLPGPIAHTDPVSVRYVRADGVESFTVGRVVLQEVDDHHIVGTRVTIEGAECWELMQP